MRNLFLSSTLLSLTLNSVPVFAADEIPAAMKIPVDSTTVPAATTDQSVPNSEHADNTSRNAIHDGEKAVSADEQSNAKGDVEITRKIRRAIVKDKSMSSNAHNVKIITVQGRVVLKGPVATNEEKMKVETIAGRVAGRDHMVSEIEVKAK